MIPNIIHCLPVECSGMCFQSTWWCTLWIWKFKSFILKRFLKLWSSRYLFHFNSFFNTFNYLSTESPFLDFQCITFPQFHCISFKNVPLRFCHLSPSLPVSVCFGILLFQPLPTSQCLSSVAACWPTMPLPSSPSSFFKSILLVMLLQFSHFSLLFYPLLPWPSPSP